MIFVQILSKNSILRHGERTGKEAKSSMENPLGQTLRRSGAVGYVPWSVA
jgi:hypothetical protein